MFGWECPAGPIVRVGGTWWMWWVALSQALPLNREGELSWFVAEKISAHQCANCNRPWPSTSDLVATLSSYYSKGWYTATLLSLLLP